MAKRMQTKKPYVQFSKKVVIAVCIAVTIISLIGIFLDYSMRDAEQATNIIKVYIQYAMVVFAAYSGNSAVEKWLVSNHKISDATRAIKKDEQEEENEYEDEQ